MKRVDTTIRLLVEMTMTTPEQEFMINAEARDWADGQALVSDQSPPVMPPPRSAGGRP